MRPVRGPTTVRVEWSGTCGEAEGQIGVLRKIFVARAELSRREHLTPNQSPEPAWIPEGTVRG
jgi:hypothetical protein